jgi:hypothetical protein
MKGRRRNRRIELFTSPPCFPLMIQKEIDNVYNCKGSHLNSGGWKFFC